MSESKDSEFVKALLAQEPMLNGAAFQEHRSKILERLAVAERQERRSRRLVVGATATALAVLSAVFGLLFFQSDHQPHWPDWITYLLALAVILFPFCSLLLAAIYFGRHWRELRRARDQAYRSALLNLPREIEELRRELSVLRREISSKDRGAFTVMELLSVVTVLGILVSLALPGLAQAKEKARSIQCTGNLSQLARGLIMYEGEERGYPGAGFPVVAQRMLTYRTDDSWDMRILPFVFNNTNLFNCPSERPRMNGQLKMDTYGYNAGGTCRINDFTQNLGLGFAHSFTNTAMSVVRPEHLRSPSEMIALGDLQMPPGVWINTITPNVPQPLGGLKTVVAPRHRGGANAAFCDGHVEFAKLARWIAPSDSDRRRWNNDHEPHPETW
jgi:prepilin-type processing-associated H-X9-DG protein